MTPDDEVYSLNTEEEYENLRSLQYSKPIKVFIIAKPSELSLAEVQPKEQEELQIEEIEGSDSHIEAMSLSLEESDKQDRNSENHEMEIRSESSAKEEQQENSIEDLIGKLQRNCEAKLSEVPDLKPDQESQIKGLVQATIQEQMNAIVSQVKETLLKEGLIHQQPNNVPYNNNMMRPPQQMMPQPPSQYPGQYYPYYQQPYPQGVQPVYARYPPVQPNNQPHVNLGPRPEERRQSFSNPQQIPNRENEPDFLDKVMNMIVELPGKAVDFVDNIARKIEGDPLVVCAEGRYSKSVVDKAGFLKEVFSDADKKELLDFVERFPKEIPLNQIADLWMAQKQAQIVQKQEAQENANNTN